MDHNEILKQNKDAGEALLRLRFSADYQALANYMRNRLNYMRKRGDTLSGQEREWNQGQCQAYQYLLDLPDTILPRQ